MNPEIAGRNVIFDCLVSDAYIYEKCNWNFEDKRKQKMRRGYRSHFKDLMKDSLITGLPSIATAKSKLRAVIKLLVFLVCTGGFFYQTSEFLEIYLQYPTTQDVIITYPKVISVPSVTVCNRNRINRQIFCKIFKEDCSWEYNTWDDFCRAYPRFCPEKKPDDFVFGMPLDLLGKSLGNRSKEFLETMNPETAGRKLISDCFVNDVYIFEKCNTNFIPFYATQIRAPQRCYTTNSLWKQPNKRPFSIDVDYGSYYIQMDMYPEDYESNEINVLAYLSIHDPHRLLNPFVQGITLRAGYFYKINVVLMNRMERLPHPYKTNCTDYLSLWQANEGTGPMTKEECITSCELDMQQEKYGCVHAYILYPHEFRICEDKDLGHDHRYEFLEICSKNCYDPCQSEQYLVTTEITGDSNVNCGKEDLHCKNQRVYVNIKFSQMSINTIKHEPKFQSVELFSYIGGYMGIWMGLSLVALFDFAEMLLDMTVYTMSSLLKKKKKNPRIRHIAEHFTHNVY